MDRIKHQQFSFNASIAIFYLVLQNSSMPTTGIALHLHLTPKTIEYHKYQIILKLNVQTCAQLISYAVKHGITSI